MGFNVGLNGVIEGVDVDDGRVVWGMDGGEGGKDGIGRLRECERRVVEVGEDAGVVVEWVSGRAGEGKGLR